MENVVLTPHIGWKRLETRQRLLEMVAETVRRFLAGDPINVVVSGETTRDVMAPFRSKF